MLIILFLERSSETLGVEIDFFTIDAADLYAKLCKLYAEARPKIASTTTENTEYHNNTIKNLDQRLTDILQTWRET